MLKLEHRGHFCTNSCSNIYIYIIRQRFVQKFLLTRTKIFFDSYKRKRRPFL
nr:MAG TPA: hypothetical protein [Caudoviricetes sp.]